jgi:hypothetical protein
MLPVSKKDGRRDSQSNTVKVPSADAPSNGASVIDVLDHVLDKGIVIDAWMKVSLVGIDLLTVEARVLVASIETYVQQAEAVSHFGALAAGQLAAGQLAARQLDGIAPSSKLLPKEHLSPLPKAHPSPARKAHPSPLPKARP